MGLYSYESLKQFNELASGLVHVSSLQRDIGKKNKKNKSRAKDSAPLQVSISANAIGKPSVGIHQSYKKKQSAPHVKTAVMGVTTGCAVVGTSLTGLSTFGNTEPKS